MLRYALMCITAFMFICGRNNIHTINIQPIPPFSGNFLREVSDFDNIVEPETNQEPVANVIKTRGSMNEEDSLIEDNNEKCPHCGESDRVNPARKNTDINNIKRELGEMGTLFVNKLLGSDEESAERLERDEEGEKDDDDKEVDQNQKYKDEEFIEEQDKAENLTKQSKLLFDQIENPPPKNEAEQILCCDEEDSNKQKSRGFVNSGFNKRPNSDLQMHFYKYQPYSRTKAVSDSKKSVLINLYPKHKKGRSSESPNKYDYIALLSNNNRLVQVPAVKFTVVPEESEGIKGRLRRSENFEPFYVYKYRKHPHRFRFEPVDNMFRVVDTNKVNYRRLPHIPILFVNTIPQIRKRFTNKLHKRSSNFDLSDNKYLREADLLIQNLNTSLQMGLGLSNKARPVDAGVLVSSNYDASSMNQNIKGNNKKAFKKEVVEDFASSALQDEAMSFGSGVERGSFNGDSEAPLVKEDNLVKSDVGSFEYAPSPMESAPTQADSFVNSDVGSMEVDSNKDSLAKNEFSPIELGPSKVDNYVNNIMSPFNLLPQKKDKLVKSEVSPMEIGPNKIDSFVKSVMSPLEGFPSRENGLVKSEISPMEMGSSKVDNLVKSEISPMEMGSRKVDNLVKSEISPIEVGSNKADNLVKNEISPMEVGSSRKADNLVKNEISSTEVESSKANKLVKSEISPIEVESSKADNLVKSEISPIEVESSKADNLVKSEISPIEVESSKADNNLVKSEIGLMEVGSSKADNMIKSEISPMETDSSKDNNFVKNVINPLQIDANKQDHLTKNEISPINVASKYNSVVKSEIDPVGVVPNKESNLIKSEINPMIASPNKKENFVKNDVASGLYKSNVVNSDLNKPLQLNKGLSNGMVKSQIDPVLQNVPNDNTFSENQVDSKVGDLSENMVETKVDEGLSAKVVDTKDTVNKAKNFYADMNWYFA